MTSSANWGWRVRDFPLLRWFLKGPWMIRLWRGADWIFEQNVAAVMVVPLLFVSYCLFFYLYLATLRKWMGYTCRYGKEEIAIYYTDSRSVSFSAT
jgi:hypothetical protein